MFSTIWPSPAATLLPTSRASSVDGARTLWALTGFSLALLLGFAAASTLDPRTLDGANVWLKPAKFALSFGVLFATLALVVERLTLSVRQGWPLRITLAAMVVATWTEMAYIGGRAGSGLASHFAVGTPLEATLYGLMGLGAVTLVAGIGVIGWLAGRDTAADLGPGLRLGVRWGFLLSAVLTLVTAGYLSSNNGHFVGVPSVEAATLPLLGWSGEVGDLRPAHFLALHAMQVLPLLGWWLDRHARASLRVLWIAGTLYATLTAAVFVQALMGLPLVRL